VDTRRHAAADPRAPDPFSVLVVDDDPEVRESLRDVLSEEGYAVTEAGDGADALATLGGSTVPDLVLLDLGMPNMDGYEFLERREASAKLKAVPVIVISGTTDPRRFHGLVDATLPKPLNVPVLLRVVNRAVHRHREARH
jgi:CheY-like chemotaxis protein